MEKQRIRAELAYSKKILLTLEEREPQRQTRLDYLRKKREIQKLNKLNIDSGASTRASDTEELQ